MTFVVNKIHSKHTLIWKTFSRGSSLSQTNWNTQFWKENFIFHYNMCCQNTTQNVHVRYSILLPLNPINNIKGQMPTLPIYLSENCSYGEKVAFVSPTQLLSQSWSYLHPCIWETYNYQKHITFFSQQKELGNHYNGMYMYFFIKTQVKNGYYMNTSISYRQSLARIQFNVGQFWSIGEKPSTMVMHLWKNVFVQSLSKLIHSEKWIQRRTKK